jgi:hypothetical protein
LNDYVPFEKVLIIDGSNHKESWEQRPFNTMELKIRSEGKEKGWNIQQPKIIGINNSLIDFQIPNIEFYTLGKILK